MMVCHTKDVFLVPALCHYSTGLLLTGSTAKCLGGLCARPQFGVNHTVGNEHLYYEGVLLTVVTGKAPIAAAH